MDSGGDDDDTWVSVVVLGGLAEDGQKKECQKRCSQVVGGETSPGKKMKADSWRFL